MEGPGSQGSRRRIRQGVLVLDFDDVGAWNAYPQHRWIFNKLEVALRLGYDAAPIMVPVTKPCKYIIRPIYNLYGMGIGAHAKDLDPRMDFEDHVVGEPGTFWCEYFEGDHVSVDYKWVDEGKGGIHSGWRPVNAMQGVKSEHQGLFESWTRVKPELRLLPDWVEALYDVTDLNIEWIGNRIIEVHLRTGNDVIANLPLGTQLIPLWEGGPDMPDDCVFVPNEEEGRYDASGYLPMNRLGYYMKRRYPDW